MRQEYVNPFLAPARTVWRSELGHSLELASTEGVAHRFTTEDITAAIGISGHLQGSVLYGFPRGTARAVIDLMLGSEVDARSELALSTFGGIANMITGNAATPVSAISHPWNTRRHSFNESPNPRVHQTGGRPAIAKKS